MDVVESGVSREFEVLSTKLVASIEKQATLEDQMHWTDAALDRAKTRISELEMAQRDCVERMANVLQEKRGAEEETQALMTRLVEETRLRGQAEAEKQAIEKELEDLTKTLFEEANQMVTAAQHERDRAERRSMQLQAQLEEAEKLQKSQQKQLEELKGLLHAVTGSAAGALRTGENGEEKGGKRVRRVFRSDIAAFQEFQAFFSTVNVQKRGGEQGGEGQSVQTAQNGQNGGNGGGGGLGGPVRVSSPSFFGLGSPTGTSSFRDWKFIKRCIYEDIEPTLRLDSAPGLSWLARRTMFSAILEGQLVIEPGKVGKGGIICSLCGNSCTEEGNRRVHRFRTSEAQNTMKFYYLCGYCLRRVRSVCDFAGFLRQLRDGVWRAEGDDEGIKAWEETVRLREVMFWSRVGAIEGVEGPAEKVAVSIQ